MSDERTSGLLTTNDVPRLSRYAHFSRAADLSFISLWYAETGFASYLIDSNDVPRASGGMADAPALGVGAP